MASTVDDASAARPQQPPASLPAIATSVARLSSRIGHRALRALLAQWADRLDDWPQHPGEIGPRVKVRAGGEIESVWLDFAVVIRQ